MTETHTDMTTPQHIIIEELASTNLKLKEICDTQKLEEFSIVQTNYQYAGRGQMGNHWESERNKNLTFSTLLKPEHIAIHEQFILSKVVSLAIYNTLKSINIADVHIKWPNDIYCGNKKIAGILIENSIMGQNIFNSIIGIGLNINQELFTPNAGNATSLKIITGTNFNLKKVLNQLVKNIIELYIMSSTEEAKTIHQKYLDHLYRYQKKAHYKDKHGDYSGTITGVDSSGRLKITTDKGIKKVYGFKEVEFIIEDKLNT